MSVYSSACTPLSSHGSTAAWFNARGQASEIARNWGEVICSAAPGSTVTLASMFIFEGSRSVDGLIADLSAVAAYRHVHVTVIVAKSQFSKSEYAQFTHSFSFATLHECTYGCTEAGTKARMHLKFMTISSSTFGGSVVIESTLNWSPQQMDRQNGSALYFYNNPLLYKAYTAEALRVEHRVRATEATLQRRWTDAGTDIAYAFNPSTVTSDPIVDELSSLPRCRKGDFVDVINANVTRGRFVGILDKLRSEDCTVRVITEHLFRPQNADYTIRHLTTHDKFVLVHVAGMEEVMTGSEDYRPTSLTLADEQLVRVRLPSVVEAFEHWFATEWALAA